MTKIAIWFWYLEPATFHHETPNIVPALTHDELPANADYVTVFEQIYQQSQPWTIEKTSQETDIPKETIIRLARDYATTKPAMIVQNMSGAQRTEFGAYVASQFYLALLTGNIGKKKALEFDAGGARQMAKFAQLFHQHRMQNPSNRSLLQKWVIDCQWKTTSN